MEQTSHILAALEATGLLLVQDKSFPNVVTLVTGETPRGSWWAHPRSHEIFRSLSAIAADPAVLVTKLIDRKVTFVHQRLWPAFLSVASACAPGRRMASQKRRASSWTRSNVRESSRHRGPNQQSSSTGSWSTETRSTPIQAST